MERGVYDTNNQPKNFFSLALRNGIPEWPGPGPGPGISCPSSCTLSSRDGAREILTFS